jgi:D-sedoheptulose 7-phosphate isomerase
LDEAQFVEDYFSELRRCLAAVSVEQVLQVAGLLRRAMEQDRTVFVIGNGGSAATASHMASDLCRTRAGSGQPGLRAVSLTDNIAAFTATANDTSYDSAFAELLALQARAGDVLLALSGSGNSPNIVQAVRVARERGATTVGLAGFGGGALGAEVDFLVCVDSRHYGAVEDLHLALGHLLAMILAGPARMSDPGARPPSSLDAKEV